MVDVLSFATASTTPGTNASINGVSVLGTGLVSTADDSFRNSLAIDAKFYSDLGGTGTTGGSANAITLTTPTLHTALVNGMFVAFKNSSGPNTTAVTLNVDALGAKAIRLEGDSALVGGEMVANGIYLLRYDTAYNSAAGAWVLLNPASASNTTSNDPFINFAINTPTVAASALTITFTGVDGNAISATNIAYINFRSATAGSGAIAQLALNSAQSLVVPSGASLGSTNAVATTYALAAFNNAGAIIYGIINPLVLPLVDGIATTTLLSGSSTSAGVWYTTTALTSKAYTVVGYITATEATAGTWATAPSTVQVATSAVTSNAYSSQGTWTPSLGGNTTYTARFGTYVKIGNYVFLSFSIVVNAIGTGSTTQISGLPSLAGPTNYGVSGSASFWSLPATALTYLGCYISSGGGVIQMTSTIAAGNASISTAVFGNSTTVIGSVAYIIGS